MQLALRGLAALPATVRARLAGPPTVVDGQRLHPDVQLVLKVLNAGDGETFEQHPVPQARQELDGEAWVFGTAPRVATVREFSVPGPAGPIPCREYRASGATGAPAPGLVMYLHGGGWVLGGFISCDAVCRVIARRTGCVVVSVDYRLAPEHPFPAGPDDCVAAFRWLRDHTATFGVPAGRVAVAGESAGGNMTAVVAQQTRNDQEGGPAFQCPICPSTDMSTRRPSRDLFAEGYFLTDAQLDWYHDHYATPEQRTDPRCSPLLAETVEGVAPACVVVAGFDPLRDDGLAYVEKLRADGVATQLLFFEGFIHGFINATGLGPVVVSRVEVIADAIALGLGVTPLDQST